MRTPLLCCAIVAHAAIICEAQSLSQVIPANQRAHDFGAVASYAKTEHEFQLYNPYSQPLHIRGVRASCGCTTPIVLDKTIKPGESGRILARYNTDKGMFGRKSATLTVSFDRPFYTEIQLNVKGYIRRDIVLHPGEASLGAVPEGEGKNLELILNYAGRNDWKIQEIVSPMSFVDAEFEEVSRNGSNIQYKLMVKLDGTAPAGTQQGDLVIKTNDHNLKSFPVHFAANVESSLQASPASLALGDVKPGEPIKKKLVLKGREPFKILDISSEMAEIRFDPNESSKKAHLINIVIAPEKRGADIEGSIAIKTDMRDEPLTIKLSYSTQTESLASTPQQQVATQGPN